MEEEKYMTGLRYQKSTNFLLPLTDIGNKAPLPTCSYLYWNGEENIDNFELIVYYKTIYDEKFKEFEKTHILQLDKLSNCYNVNEGIVYIFDLIANADDVYQFMQGHYSRFSNEAKNKILKFCGGFGDGTVKPGRPIHMALYPESYFYVVAKELNYDVDDLRDIGELCQKFNLKDETANFDIINERCCKPEKQILYQT